ncbi:alpha-amylase family protein [Streptomyces sp. TS71-3]|uniref:alpha-amylase family protein n=1 Tax=Streptomyces sp. TS71-3 TaxID=2733862 RepID=UPI001BB3CB85|nr:alpha-amylase family protein [Streptomyces sp. TS71-3]
MPDITAQSAPGRHPEPTPERHTGTGGRGAGWVESATRWIQLTLAEDDPAHFDAEFWLELMRESRANALCLSAGGYVAYYPTRIPLHHRSAFLGGTDPFGTLVEGARKLGMHVMARVDPHAVHADAAEAHPEWLALGQDGRPLEHWSLPGAWLTCPFSDYHGEFITEVAREIAREYDIDAVFANRWDGHGGISYSAAARDSFRADTGRELPREEGRSDDPAWPAYVAWRRGRLGELVARWDAAVKSERPHASFIPNLGATTVRDLDPVIAQRYSPFFVIDRQGRSGTEPLWTAGQLARRSRAAFPDRPAQLISSVGPEHRHRWKDSVAPAAEVRTWIADGFVHGINPWMTKFNAAVPDRRWVAPVADLFRLHARLEPVLRDLRTAADVAVLDGYPSPHRSGAERLRDRHDDGIHHALVAARIPFELISDSALTAERLARHRLLVLTGAERLGPREVGIVRDFVSGGGSLVAVHRAGLLDEDGAERADFALGDVLGVRLREPARTVRNNYIALTGPEHPLHAGPAGAGRIIGGTSVLGIEAADGTEVPFRFVPDFPDLPMEEVYARAEPDAPAVVCRQAEGGGRTVYAAFDLGAVYWEALQLDHGRLIADAVRWALGPQPAVRVDGSGLVDVAVRRGPRALSVALVNLDDPSALRGTRHEVRPLPPQTVSAALPPGARDVTARLLVAGTDVPVRVADGRAEVTVAEAELLEVALLTWSDARSSEAGDAATGEGAGA